MSLNFGGLKATSVKSNKNGETVRGLLSFIQIEVLCVMCKTFSKIIMIVFKKQFLNK